MRKRRLGRAATDPAAPDIRQYAPSLGCARSQKCRNVLARPGKILMDRTVPDSRLREEDEKNKLDNAARSAEIDQTITQTEDIRKTRKLRQEYSRRVYLFLRN